MREQTVAVLFGGPSAEHEVSIDSARNVCRALLDGGYPVVPVLWRREGDWILGARMDARPDQPTERVCDSAFQALTAAHPIPVSQAIGLLGRTCETVFVCAHGQFGEDGVVQGLLRMVGLPFVGSGVCSSALCMEKDLAKEVVRARGIAVPDGLVVRRSDWELNATEVLRSVRELSYPRMVKPVDAGSSVGMSRVEEPSEMAGAIDLALASREAGGVLIEEWIDGSEMTCAVLGNPESGLQTLPPILIKPPQGRLFDYDAKYSEDGAEELCPAPVPPDWIQRVEADSLTAYRTLGCRGFARADFMVSEDGQPYFLEMNTLPGLTARSLVPLSAGVAGISMSDLMTRLVDLAEEESIETERSMAVGGGR